MICVLGSEDVLLRSMLWRRLMVVVAMEVAGEGL